MFDVDSNAEKAIDADRYNLDWIRNKDLRHQIGSKFYTTPENLKRSGIDLKDYPAALQIIELLDSMSGGGLRGKIKTYVENYVDECQRVIKSYDFVDEFAPIIAVLDKNFTKLPKILELDFLKNRGAMEFWLKGDCREQLNQIFQGNIRKQYDIDLRFEEMRSNTILIIKKL